MKTKAERSRKAAADKKYHAAHPATDETRVQEKKRVRKHRKNQSQAVKRYYTVQGVRRRAAVGISERTRERNRLRAAAHRLLAELNRQRCFGNGLTMPEFLLLVRSTPMVYTRRDGMPAVTSWGRALRVGGQIVATDLSLLLYLNGGEALEAYLDSFVEDLAGNDGDDADGDDADGDDADGDDADDVADGDDDAAPPGGAAGALVVAF